MSPLLLLGAVWMLVIGYTLIYVGYNGFNGKSVKFADVVGIGSFKSSGSGGAGTGGSGGSAPFQDTTPANIIPGRPPGGKPQSF